MFRGLIYKFVNKINGKTYIGKDQNPDWVKNRYYHHKRADSGAKAMHLRNKGSHKHVKGFHFEYAKD